MKNAIKVLAIFAVCGLVSCGEEPKKEVKAEATPAAAAPAPAVDTTAKAAAPAVDTTKKAATPAPAAGATKAATPAPAAGATKAATPATTPAKGK